MYFVYFLEHRYSQYQTQPYSINPQFPQLHFCGHLGAGEETEA